MDDAVQVLNIQREVVAENDFLITLPAEFNQPNHFEKILENKRETVIVAEVDGVVVGWIMFHSPNRKRLSHTGSFGMMIAKAYRGIGIGKMLIAELLDWAQENPLIEKVSLGALSTNQRAIALYKSMGFKEECRKVKEQRFHTHFPLPCFVHTQAVFCHSHSICTHCR